MSILKKIQDLARPHWADILRAARVSGGISLADLSAQLGLSYTGLRKHCEELEKKGYLTTWRHPKETGRPEKVWRLSSKGRDLFQEEQHHLTLEFLQLANHLFGPMSAERIFHHYFAGKTRQYRKKLRGQSLVEKVESLAHLREAEGHGCACSLDAAAGLRLIEHHHPLAALFQVYPSFARMETRMISQLLGASVERAEEVRPDHTNWQVFTVRMPGEEGLKFPLDEKRQAELEPF